MPSNLTPIFSEEFALRVAEIDARSAATGANVREVVRHLQAFPDMGNPQPRRMLRQRYGESIRTIAVDGYLLVYRHDDQKLWLIALPWGHSVR